jgi:pimeloyl-ACP methyl ester carboxylesterase
MSSFTHRGRRISYGDHGSGTRAIVLTHGLLMDSRMYTKLAPKLAARGHRVITADMLGHGSSDKPYAMTEYSMPQFGRDVVALLDHLGLAEAVVGGTSLGANVALETSQRLMGWVSALTRKIPRTHYLIDIAIDFVRRDPAASLAVLDGLIFGRVAPPIEERNALAQPTLVIGHPSDPIHPFSDADRIARELVNARLVTAHSMFEWRVRPERLTRELLGFLDEVWRHTARGDVAC